MGALITPFIEMKEADTLKDITDDQLREYLKALVDQIKK
jgi:hypothetical protein